MIQLAYMPLSERRRIHLEKVRLLNIGRPCPESTKTAVSLANTGKIPWNRGRVDIYSPETRMRMSAAKKGRKLSDEHKEKLRGTFTDSRRKDISKRSSKMIGDLNPNWRGGKTEQIRLIRKSDKYKKWRRSVLERDGKCCVLCGGTTSLEVDHIKPCKDFPELMFDLENGRVLCSTCHKRTPTYGRRNKT